MLFEKQHYLWGFMVRRMVDEQNDTSDVVSQRICDEITQMLSKFYVSPSLESIPNDVFMWPK